MVEGCLRMSWHGLNILTAFAKSYCCRIMTHVCAPALTMTLTHAKIHACGPHEERMPFKARTEFKGYTSIHNHHVRPDPCNFDLQELRSSTFGRPSCRYREVWELDSARQSRKFWSLFVVARFCSPFPCFIFVTVTIVYNCHCACRCHCVLMLVVVAVVVVAVTATECSCLPFHGWLDVVWCCLVFSNNRRAEQPLCSRRRWCNHSICHGNLAFNMQKKC